MKTLVALLKREFWEHNGAFVLTPLVIAGLFLSASIYVVIFHANPESEFGSEFFDLDDVSPGLNEVTGPGSDDGMEEYYIDFTTGELVAPEDIEAGRYYVENEAGYVVLNMMNGIHFMFMMIIGFVIMFYMLSSLYGDRKDRSVLFWKSMPVSESRVVLIKLAVAMFAVPFLVTLVAWVTEVVYMLMAMLFLYRVDVDPWTKVGSQISLVPLFIEQLKFVLWLAIWWLPVYAWLMFASAFARRSPFLVAFVPIAVVIGFEYLISGSWTIASLLGQQVQTIGTQLSNYENTMEGSVTGSIDMFLNESRLVTGVIIAAVLLPVTIWLRNHRFEI